MRGLYEVCNSKNLGVLSDIRHAPVDPPEWCPTQRCVRRAYKLGKKRWSYNQCALTLHQAGGLKTLCVSEAASSQQSVPQSQKVSEVARLVDCTSVAFSAFKAHHVSCIALNGHSGALYTLPFDYCYSSSYVSCVKNGG